MIQNTVCIKDPKNRKSDRRGVAPKEYDKGEILFQTSVAIGEGDTPEIIAKKVLGLEHEFFPRVIEEYVLSGEV